MERNMIEEKTKHKAPHQDAFSELDSKDRKAGSALPDFTGTPVHVSTNREGKGTWESDDLRHDIEKNLHLERPNDSYAGFGALMNGNSDVAIVRKFGDLNAQNILYLQAELVTLENKLRKQEYHDRYYGEGVVRNFHHDYGILVQHEESAQYSLLARIREKLREYNEALKNQHFLSNLPERSKYDIRWLRRWLRHRQYGNRFITSDDADVYEPLSEHHSDRVATTNSGPNTSQKLRPTMEQDLVSLGTGGPKDPFSKWVINGLLVAWHRIFGREGKKPEIVAVSEDPALRLVSVLSTVIASLLPVAVVFVLQRLPENPRYLRLGVFAAFTVVFALLMIPSLEQSEVKSSRQRLHLRLYRSFSSELTATQISDSLSMF